MQYSINNTAIIYAVWWFFFFAKQSYKAYQHSSNSEIDFTSYEELKVTLKRMWSQWEVKNWGQCLQSIYSLSSPGL